MMLLVVTQALEPHSWKPKMSVEYGGFIAISVIIVVYTDT
jgi:hypothetical protein